MQTDTVQAKETFLRSDRQENFSGKPFASWPAPEHNPAATTVDRVGDDVAGGPHRFGNQSTVSPKLKVSSIAFCSFDRSSSSWPILGGVLDHPHMPDTTVVC